MDISKFNFNQPWRFDGRYIMDSKNNVICQIIGDNATQISLASQIAALPDLIAITHENLSDAIDAEEDRGGVRNRSKDDVGN